MNDLQLLVTVILIGVAYFVGYFLGAIHKVNSVAEELKNIRGYLPTLNTSLRYLLGAERRRNRYALKGNKMAEENLKLNRKTVKLHEKAARGIAKAKKEEAIAFRREYKAVFKRK